MEFKNSAFVGSTTGIIKCIYIRNDPLGLQIRTKNHVNTSISNNEEIYCMSWFDKSQNDVLAGKKNGIKIYNINDNRMNDILVGSEYSVRGVFNHEGILVFGSESGVVRFWAYPYEKNQWEELKVGDNLSSMKQSVLSSNIFATGGKENDLKLWDAVAKKCTFHAKNIKPDKLQLRVPIWISDISFLKNSEKVVYCSRHGHVRLFDPLLPQRRPVVNAHLQDEVFTCISTTPDEYTFLVGSGSGNLHLVDLRGKGSFIGKYKGFSGAVKGVTCISDENNPLVFSVSLDRHFRIHDFKTRKLLLKEYTQSRLTSVLIRDDFKVESVNVEDTVEETSRTNRTELKRKKKKHLGDKNDLEEVFENLETIREVLKMDNNDELDDDDGDASDDDDDESNNAVGDRKRRRKPN